MSFWSRRDGIAFLLCFIAALGVYVYSLPPSITLEDAGELAVAADYLGVPHPPGYPIWTFFAWLFQWLFHFVRFQDYPNPAWAIALMSAFFGSLACGLVAVCIRKLLDGLTVPVEAKTQPGIKNLVAEGSGAACGLLLFSLLFSFPIAGKILLGLLLIGFLFLVTLQALKLEKRTPSISGLGWGLWGFLISAGIWTAVWLWLVRPGIVLLLPLSLLGLGLYFLLSQLSRYLLKRALGHPNFKQHLYKSGTDLWLSVGGGLLLAFTPLMWSQSVIIEVYSLNAFFLSALLLLVLWYLHQPQDGILYLGAFLFALGLTNHQSLLFLVFFLITGVALAHNQPLLNDWRLFRQWRKLCILLLMGGLGVSFHLFMPLASEQNPPMNWGNTRSAEGFKHVLTRGQYERFSVAENVKQIARSLSTPVPNESEATADPDALIQSYATRSLFFRMLGAFFHDADWKYSIANQFSWQFPAGKQLVNAQAPPPPEKNIPLALLGLLPLLCFGCFPRQTRGWFISSMVAIFFLTVVFLIIQWPELNHNDLWVKRVQYVQAHVLFSIWMSLGAAVVMLFLYALLPKPAVLGCFSAGCCVLFIFFPLHKDAKDPRHHEYLGRSNLHGQRFGWEYGFHMLKGANGILLDELAHHQDPDLLLNDWAVDYLQQRAFPTDPLDQLIEQVAGQRMPRSSFRKIKKQMQLSAAHQRLLEQAMAMAAFRALSPKEQTEALRYLHAPLPDWDYPPEMDQNGILFGGTDPGRFVPTYMVFSANVRPDLFVLTQTALADGTYQNTTREFYGDQIWLPDLIDSNQAFLDYGNQLRLFHPQDFYQLMSNGETLAISGVDKVNELNSILSRQIFDRNRLLHSFYFEEAIQIRWMIPYLRPHGLIFQLADVPGPLNQEEIDKDLAFWEWYEEHLMGRTRGQRGRYLSDLQVRKSYSKLRMSQAWNYYERGNWEAATSAMDQALRFYPANPEASLRAGDMYIRMLKFDRAREVLDQFALHDPTHHQRAAFSASLEKLEELNTLRISKEQNPDPSSPGNHALQLMQIYGQLEMKSEMLKKGDEILQMPGLHSDFYIHLAAYMQRREDHATYRKAIEKWAEVSPDDARPQIDLAAISLAEKDYDAMVLHMVKAIHLAPERSRRQLAADPRFVDIHHWQQFQKLIRLPSSSNRSPSP